MGFESYLLLLSAAFFASFSHCIGMCGGIVVGLNMRQFNHSKSLQVFANILYFCGRMCSYVIIGLCFVIIGKSFGFSQTAQAIIFIVLGILLFITAFIITFYPKILGNVTPSGNYAWYKKAFYNALHARSIFGFFIVGILNGLLPCHLVYMFAIKAADSLNIWYTIISMLVFSLGTFLPLFLVGLFSQQFLHSTLRRFFLYIAFIIMSYFAFINIYKGVQLLLEPENAVQHQHDMSHMQNKDNHAGMPHIDSNPHTLHEHRNQTNQDNAHSMHHNHMP